MLAQRAGCNGNAAGGQGAHALWSSDHGVSWHTGQPLAKGTNECQLARLSNGSLYMNTRSSNHDRLVAISNDEGMSWSEPVVESQLSGTATCEGSLIAVEFSLPGPHTQPRTALFFSHPQAPDRTHMTIRMSVDGQTWPESASALVWAGGSAYSSLGVTADGMLAVLWEKDGKDLAFARVDTGLSLLS